MNIIINAAMWIVARLLRGSEMAEEAMKIDSQAPVRTWYLEFAAGSIECWLPEEVANAHITKQMNTGLVASACSVGRLAADTPIEYV